MSEKEDRWAFRSASLLFENDYGCTTERSSPESTNASRQVIRMLWYPVDKLFEESRTQRKTHIGLYVPDIRRRKA